MKVSESTIVLTGGRITLNLVTEYSGLETGGWEVQPFAYKYLVVLCKILFAILSFTSRCQADSCQALELEGDNMLVGLTQG